MENSEKIITAKSSEELFEEKVQLASKNIKNVIDEVHKKIV
jgi:hypothetical protein